MKRKLSIGLLSRWVIAPLLASSLIAWGVSPAYSGNNQNAEASRTTSKQALSGLPVKIASDSNVDIQEIKDRVKELEAKERQNYATVLDGQRKTMDWWFSFLAVLTALMAIFGVFIPFLMARKDKEMIELDKEQIKKLLEEVKGMKADAEDTVEKMHQHEADAEKILNNFQSGKPSNESDSQISAAVATIEQDKNADTPLRLRAEAIAASQAKDAAKAYALWNALIALTPSDASALFNAGYWAQELGNRAQGTDNLHWLKQAGTHYQQALVIEPDKQEAANNWGNALAVEAGAVSAQDLTSARALWKQAGEKYQQALVIKPDAHKTAGNWGTALITEASTLATNDAGESKRLLDEAEQLLLAHADAAPDVVAYNLACVYGLRVDIQKCLHWLNIGLSHKQLPDCAHLRNDKDMDAVRKSPEFIAWLATTCNDKHA